MKIFIIKLNFRIWLLQDPNQIKESDQLIVQEYIEKVILNRNK